MSDSAVVGYDAIGAQTSSLPRGAQIYAGYSTGSGIVPWTASQFAKYATALGPCLRICQDPSASDPAADYLDVEYGAATYADCPVWAKRALASFKAGTRRGQRSPAIYMSGSNVSSVVDALVAGGVTSGVGLIVANWSITEASAVADVLAAAGPFPIVGIQFSDPGPYDVNIFSRNWLLNQAGGGVPAPVPVPKPSVAPAFPYPATGYLGVTSADPDCHSGFNAADRPHVETWQRQMAARGWMLSVDGDYGILSQTACESFQQEKGLAVDGKVGPVTWKASWADPVT